MRISDWSSDVCSSDLMMETVDGEYQNCKAFGGAYTRQHFFGKYAETAALVDNLSDDDISSLNRGGHDPHKVYAAYHAAVHTTGMSTVLLAKTVTSYGMGASGRSGTGLGRERLWKLV